MRAEQLSLLQNVAYLPQFQGAIIEILLLNKNRERDEVSKKKGRKQYIHHFVAFNEKRDHKGVPFVIIVVGAVVVAVPLVKESDDGREPVEEKVWGEGGRGGGGSGRDGNSSFALLRRVGNWKAI
jgi:hypothetical protein